jgi:tetratricopeptide (TPR) repeat protein
MGSVYRVLDRLTGRVVTLKKLHTRGREASAAALSHSADGRVTLAQEFRFLASLRHPNIINVLDYGFDEDLEPFFTMDLRENAHTIIEAGLGQPLSVQVELLVQLLRAVAYLHHHGIIHRDLKPENVLVENDQVKLVDLGLSLPARGAEVEAAQLAGTFTHMAPEMWRGEAASPRTDLYAVGLIALELLTGSYPFTFKRDDLLSLQQDIQETELPRPTDEVEPRLIPVLKKLLSKRPEDRHQDATEVIAALAVALGQPLSAETVTTRESFLQAAPFVGRKPELDQLWQVLRRAIDGEGSAWLVGGESGVGKSRLLEELRIRALVEGVVVLRGQANSQGGDPYHAWRDVISSLVLRIDLEDSDAGVISAIVPNIADLLDRRVPDPTELGPEAAQSRLLFAVEEVFRRQPKPVLVLLEDLQWVGSESLALWDWLASEVEGLPLALVGSYRSDEAGDLPQRIKATRVIRLFRLDHDEIRKLAESIIGPSAHRAEVLELIEKETEGNPFFIVEVVRALAERSGHLTDIGEGGLPSRVIPGGLQRVVRERLGKVSTGAIACLKTAAVIGREIHSELLRAIHPDLDLVEWASSCAETAVLEFRDQRWRFAHDKLREQLLDDLPDASRRDLHRCVAEALEHQRPEMVTALAHHWRHARVPSKELHYAEQAGVLALQSGACREAIGFLDRALALLVASDGTDVQTARRRRWSLDPNVCVDPEAREFRLGVIEGSLAEACFRLGDLRRSRRHLERALTQFGLWVPGTRRGWLLAMLGEAGQRVLQVLLRVRSRDLERSGRVAAAVGPAQMRLTESCFYSLEALPLIWSSLRLVNQCEPVGPSPYLAEGYMNLGLLAGVAPLPRLANRWCRRALAIAQEIGSERDVAYVLTRIGLIAMESCRWEEADRHIDRATEVAERVGDVRLWEECRCLTGAVSFFSGQFERGARVFREARRLSQRSGNKQVAGWALMGEADMLMRLGREEEALPLYEESLSQMDEDAVKTDALWGLGMRALARLRLGDEKGAYESARLALTHILGTRPTAYWIQHGTAATAEVFLTLLDREDGAGASPDSTLASCARRACVGVRRYAARFPLGRPHAQLWQGLAAHLNGRPRRALRHWRRSVELAERLRTPYELGRAHFEIGRHLSRGDDTRRDHLSRAVEGFEQLGCATELEWVRRELASGEAAP